MIGDELRFGVFLFLAGFNNALVAKVNAGSDAKASVIEHDASRVAGRRLLLFALMLQLREH